MQTKTWRACVRVSSIDTRSQRERDDIARSMRAGLFCTYFVRYIYTYSHITRCMFIAVCLSRASYSLRMPHVHSRHDVRAHHARRRPCTRSIYCVGAENVLCWVHSTTDNAKRLQAPLRLLANVRHSTQQYLYASELLYNALALVRIWSVFNVCFTHPHQRVRSRRAARIHGRTAHFDAKVRVRREHAKTDYVFDHRSRRRFDGPSMHGSHGIQARLFLFFTLPHFVGSLVHVACWPRDKYRSFKHHCSSDENHL